MKKTFLNVALISLLTVSMPATFMSCKDYDSDIASINDRLDGITGKTIVDINTTIANVQTALAKAQKDATAAGQAAEAARALAQQGVDDAAKAEATAVALHQEALAAAAQAKADALAEIAKQADALKAQIKATEDALKAGIDANAANISRNTAEIAANTAAIAANVESIGKLEASIAALEVATGEKISALDKKIDATKASLEENIAATTASLTTAINTAKADLEAQLKAANANIAKLNEDLQAAISDLNGKIEVVDGKVTAIDGRLTDAEGQIVTLNATTADLTSRITAAEKTLLEHQNYIEGLMEQIETQAQALTFLTNLVNDNYDELDGKIVAQQEEIAKLQKELSETTEFLLSLSNNFDELSRVVNANVEDIDNLQQALEAVKTNLQDQIDGLREQTLAYLDGLDKKYAEALENAQAVVADLSTRLGDAENAIKAINGSIDQINEEIQAANKNITDVYTALDSKIETIGEAMFNDMKAMKADLEDQIDGLREQMLANNQSLDEKFSEALNNAQTAIDDLNTALNGLEERLTQTIDDLHGDMMVYFNAIKAEWEETIGAIDAAINTLNSAVAGRLASVTLIPHAYVGGIPTIDFVTFKYKAFAAPAKGAHGFYEAAAPKTAKETTISGNASSAYYRLNPSNVTLDDVIASEISYDVLNNVSSRADSNNGSLVVTGTSIDENGVLKVQVKNTNFDPLDNGNGTSAATLISTAALKVPIASKHLLESEKENGAVVYSEYSRICAFDAVPYLVVNSKWATPYIFTKLDAAKGMVSNLPATVQDPAAPVTNTIVGNVTFNKTEEGGEWKSLDLKNAALGAYVMPNTDKQVVEMSADQCEDWGLSVVYSLPTEAQIHNSLTETDFDLNKYFAIDGTEVKYIGAADKVNDVIGAEFPVIITLVDNNEKSKGQVIDVQYTTVKVTYAQEAIEFNYAISTDVFCDSEIQGINWKWITETIYPELNNITASQFKQIYFGTSDNRSLYEGILNSPAKQVVYDHKLTGATSGDSFTGAGINFGNMTPEETNCMLSWKLLASQFNPVEAGVDQVYTGKVTLTDRSNVYPNVVINVTITVKMPTALPTLNKGIDAYWINGETIRMYPSNPAIGGADTDVANYMLNVLVGRTAPFFTPDKENPYLDCTTWNLNVRDYKGLIENGTRWSINGDGTPATTNSVMPGISVKDQDALESIEFIVRYNEEGKALVSAAQNEEVILTTDWQINWNGQQGFTPFGQSYIKVVYPLYFTQLRTPEIADNTKPGTVTLAKQFEITDAYKNVVYDGAGEGQFFHYYGIEADVLKFYDVANATWSYNAEPAENEEGLASAHVKIEVVKDAKGNTVLMYTPQSAVIEKDFYIHLPITVAHRWGVLTGVMTIKMAQTL